MRARSFSSSGSRSRRVRPFACIVAWATLLACGGTSTTPAPPAHDDLACLGPLAPHCCSIDTGGHDYTCLPDWHTAVLCTSWPAGTPLSIFASACHGYRAITVTGASYSTFYVYSDATSQLLAVGDNAATDPGSTAVACGAGPVDFTVPSDCSKAWLSAANATHCDPTTGTPATKAPWCKLACTANCD